MVIEEKPGEASNVNEPANRIVENDLEKADGRPVPPEPGGAEDDEKEKTEPE